MKEEVGVAGSGLCAPLSTTTPGERAGSLYRAVRTHASPASRSHSASPMPAASASRSNSAFISGLSRSSKRRDLSICTYILLRRAGNARLAHRVPRRPNVRTFDFKLVRTKHDSHAARGPPGRGFAGLATASLRLARAPALANLRFALASGHSFAFLRASFRRLSASFAQACREVAHNYTFQVG